MEEITFKRNLRILRHARRDAIKHGDIKRIYILEERIAKEMQR